MNNKGINGEGKSAGSIENNTANDFKENDDKILENELEVSEKEKKALLEENLAKLEKLYEDRNSKMTEIFNEAEKNINIGGSGIGNIEKRGVLIKGGGAVKADSGLRQDLSGDLRQIKREIDNLEKNALDVPKNLEGEVKNISKFEKEVPGEIKDYQFETEKLGEELRSDREEFVKEFIEKSVENVLHHFEDNINGTKNRINAKEIIGLKTKKEIERAAKRFIKTGDKADFGFKAILEISSYKTAVRGFEVEKKFVTGFIINVGGYEKKVRENDSPRGKNLVPGSQIIEKGKVKLKGGVKKEKIK